MEHTRHPLPVEAHSCWEDFIALDEDDLRELVDGTRRTLPAFVRGG